MEKQEAISTPAPATDSSSHADRGSAEAPPTRIPTFFGEERRLLFIWLPILLAVLGLVLTAFYLQYQSSAVSQDTARMAPPPDQSEENAANAELSNKELKIQNLANALSAEGLEALKGKDAILAEAKFREALRLQPQNTAFWNNLAISLILQKRHDEALETLATVLSIDPNNPGAHANRSQELRSLGRLDEAITEAEIAAKLTPLDPLFANRLLLMKMQAGNLASVRDAVQAQADYGVPSLEAGQIMAAAALAATDGDMPLCLRRLSRASQIVDQGTRRILLADPVFAPYLGAILAGSHNAKSQDQ
jgi:tetratricopeptide (TPR) repeat protein